MAAASVGMLIKRRLIPYLFLAGVSPDNIRKWKVLQSLQDRNETLFYK